jgi:DNA-binding YbaB/EbfC family protein
MDISQMLSALGPIQEMLKKSGAERAQTTFSGTAGGGAVTILLKGDLTVSKVTIAPAAAAAAVSDASMLEDLIAAALSDALRQYTSRYGATPEEQVQKMLGSSPLGAMLGGLGGLGGMFGKT